MMSFHFPCKFELGNFVFVTEHLSVRHIIAQCGLLSHLRVSMYRYVCMYVCTFVGSCLATKILKAHTLKLEW